MKRKPIKVSITANRVMMYLGFVFCDILAPICAPITAPKPMDMAVLIKILPKRK